jgi:hypothetical protein
MLDSFVNELYAPTSPAYFALPLCACHFTSRCIGRRGPTEWNPLSPCPTPLISLSGSAPNRKSIDQTNEQR